MFYKITKKVRILCLFLVLCSIFPLIGCVGEQGDESIDKSGIMQSSESESSIEFSSEDNLLSSEESEDISTEQSLQSFESVEESQEVSGEESSQQSIEESSDIIIEESSEQQSETLSSEISSEIPSESSEENKSEDNKKEDWSNQGVTYFEETGKCTYTTVYTPKFEDKITYDKNGIKLYNTDFKMSDELEAEFIELFGSFSNSQSITVREISTNFVFSYNPNKRIACASAIKAPFSLFISKCIEQGLVSFDERLVYEKKYDYFAGSGGIQNNYDYGTKFSVKRLYELMLYISDNIAYLMLKDRFGGASTFNLSLNAIGCKNIISQGNWGNLSSYEMANVWTEIYYYTKSGSSVSKKLYQELDRALYNQLEKGITDKENLHKSGWSANGYNDAGLFFDGEQTYAVAVMTARKELNDGRNAVYVINAAKLINKLMAEYKTYLENK